MGCCFSSNNEYESGLYGYKNFTNQSQNQTFNSTQKQRAQSNKNHRPIKKQAKLFKIVAAPSKKSSGFNNNDQNKLNNIKSKLSRNFKPTIYSIKIKSNSDKIVKYSNNIAQNYYSHDDDSCSLLVDDEGNKKCNCSCHTCKYHKNKTNISNNKPNLANHIIKKRIELKPSIRSNQIMLDKQKREDFMLSNLVFKFNLEALKKHNLYRSEHGVPQLELNNELVKIAQKHSNYLASSYSYVLCDSKYKNEKIGQSLKIYADCNIDYYSGERLTEDWYKQSVDYDYNLNEVNPSHECFTQIIWKSTLEVGFGISKASNGSFFLVAIYYPSGNQNGKFKQNVFKISQVK